MFVPFESLPSTARVWIFQSTRPFTDDEAGQITARLKSFTDEWNVHGMPLKTSFLIEHRQFIILAADEREQTASGCSIDSSVRILKELEQSLGLTLFDRDLVAFKPAEDILMIPLANLKENFANGTLDADMLTFYNLVNTKGQLESEWLVPSKNTWLKRYIPKPLAKVQ
ncbi:MAG TPA: hypothetical protein VFT90_18985 [Chryseosolibacter sp.]|nr:hypothetical protein [Chryseosolibacter sp.]